MNAYKRFSLCFVASFLLFIVGFGGFLTLLWLYDPFQFFHKPIFREVTYHGDMRMSARGLIDFSEFDSVILGSSTLANISTSEAEKLTGGKWLNISVEGGHPNVRSFVLDYVLRTKPPRRILYSLDTHSMVVDRDITSTKELQERYHPKDRLKFRIFSKDVAFSVRDLGYIVNRQFIACAFRFSNDKQCVGVSKETQIPQGFYIKNVNDKNKILGLAQIDRFKKFIPQASKKGNRLVAYNGNLQTNKARLEKYILQFVRQNPQVEFHFAISAYPTVYYAMGYTDNYEPNVKEHLDKWHQILKYLTNEAKNLPNVRIYGFDNEFTLVNDPANYIDSGHYRIGKPLNTIALRAMANQSHTITAENVDAYMNAMKANIEAYDLSPFEEALGIK